LKMRDFKITWNIQGWGILLSALLPDFVVSVFLVMGKAETHMSASSESVFIVIASLITALKAGVLEEMLFRGFIMTLLERKWNQYAAILAPSLLFGLVHIPSMEYFTIASVLLLVISGTLVGVMFSLATYKGNSISNGALMHGMEFCYGHRHTAHYYRRGGVWQSHLFCDCCDRICSCLRFPCF